MFKSLGKKLILLYTLSTGLILFIVIIILLTIAEKDLVTNRHEAFQDNINIIINKLKFENSINDSWLSQLEKNDNLLIHIEDNGKSLEFPGVYKSPTDREQLFGRLNALALNEFIDISKNPIFSNEVKSSIFTVTGEFGDIYYGSVIVIPTSSGWRSLSLLKYLPSYHTSIRNQRIMFAILGLGGIAALFLVGLLLITKMLKPIKENNERQMSFIASASHELRSPLSVISANNSAIVPACTEAEKFINGIDLECKRMARLINDLLLLASVDAKTWSVKKELMETDTILLDTYEIFQPLCNQKLHKLIIELPEEELPAISGDKDRLKQILVILLDNALSYSPEGTDITLRGYSDNNYLYIEVADHGMGISDKDKKLVFDRFYRVDPSRSDKQHFGLGLSIARELVRLLDGRIYIKDTEGGGATFVLRFKI